MNWFSKRMWQACLLSFVAFPAFGLSARTRHASIRPLAANIIVPQSRAFHVAGQPQVQVTEVKVGVVILEQAATTTMDISLRNPSGRRLEAELLVPVPEGAALKGFTFHGTAEEPTAEILPKAEAKRTYDAIVAKVRDPALLEFAGLNLLRSSVFPVEARGTQKVRLTYEHLCPADGDRVDYFLPRSESLEYRIPWNVSVQIKSKRPISTVYSPSHGLQVVRSGPNAISARIAAEATIGPGPFMLSYLLQRNGVTASLLAYPEPKENGGYFLLLAGLPAKPPEGKNGPAIKREVTLVLDRSGSMRGEKIEQAREAALQVIHGLLKGEFFNLIVYNEAVESLSPQPVARNEKNIKTAEEYLEGVTASGGTNIHDALVEALRQKPGNGALPIVMFLTDGLPTVGRTSEVEIREVATTANPHKRRVFTFGVGVDVNTPLLDKIASETRATATYVLPKEDVEVKVGQVFKRLAGPVLAEPELRVVGPEGEAATGRVLDVIPAQLPDMFEGDQLVVLGKYIGDEPLTFKLQGNYLGRQRDFKFAFKLDGATTRNSFVPRLWASRKIGVLVDAIRQMGASVGPLTVMAGSPDDPRLKELVDEIVRLSTEFGVLTEYTAFLAREGTDLSQRDQILLDTNANFVNRAIRTRDGWGAVNQSFNNDFQKSQTLLNYNNHYADVNMLRVSISTVQQVNDRAFFRRSNRWVDSRLVSGETDVEPDRVVEVGSPEFHELAEELARENRQGTISLKGEILMRVRDETVLVR